jgi:hypothetical protein
MRQILRGAIWVACVFIASAIPVCAQNRDRIVELEVKVAGAGSADHQQWAEILADVGADRVKLTSGEGARPSTSESEFQGHKIVTVIGVLETSGRLVLPGGVFTMRDAGKIRELITKLRADGAEATLAPKMAFGLTAEQLVGLGEILAQPVEFETKDQRIGDVVKKIQQVANFPLKIDSTVQAELSSAELVQEEMRGLSYGTVLAAAIRPLGLVAVPGRPVGQSVEMTIVGSRAAGEHWPIGWPPELAPGKAAPVLFERFNFELNNAPLMDALTAIQQKTQVPMLFDHNSLARAGIDLNSLKVTFNKKKQTYFGTVDDLLSQSRPRMKLELRVDEGQRPFLWISAAIRQ